MRGEVFRVRSSRGSKGREQAGQRYVVVVQSDLLPLSTWLVAPTSTSAQSATFRPEVKIQGKTTKVLVEQTTAVDPQWMGEPVSQLTFDEMKEVEVALRLVFDLS